jgi:hypothetical protein
VSVQGHPAIGYLPSRAEETGQKEQEFSLFNQEEGVSRRLGKQNLERSVRMNSTNSGGETPK